MNHHRSKVPGTSQLEKGRGEKFRLWPEGLESLSVQNKQPRNGAVAESDIPGLKVFQPRVCEDGIGMDGEARTEATVKKSQKRKEDSRDGFLERRRGVQDFATRKPSLPAVNLEPLLSFPLEFLDRNKTWVWIYHSQVG